MGYYTEYSMSVHDWGKRTPTLKREIAQKICDMYDANECMWPIASEIMANGVDSYDDNYCGLDIDGEEACKWYEHEEDMLELSRAFPNVTFKLHGDGEEKEDMWDSYYKNGKSVNYQAKIVIPPLNPKDLE